MKEIQNSNAMYFVSRVFFVLLMITLFSAVSLPAVNSDEGAEVNHEFEVNYYSTYNDFMLYSYNDELSLCQCSLYIDQIFVKNTGAYSSLYTIESNAEETFNIKFSETKFEVYPGETKKILVYLTTPCNKIGSYDYTMTVKSNLGIEKTLDRIINTGKCQNIKMFVDPLYEAGENETLSINPCTPFYYNISLQNTGSFTETYSISAEESGEYVFFSSLNVTLEPNEIKNIIAEARFPCTENGIKNIGFNIRSLKNKLIAHYSDAVEIKDNYSFDIDVPGYNFMCTYNYYSIPVTITNNMHFPNNYSIDIDSTAFFIEMNETEVSIAPGESKTVYITATPPRDKGIEGYSNSSRVIVKEATGNSESEAILVIDILDCYRPEITIKEVERKEKVCSDFYTAEIEVTNSGYLGNYFNLTLNAPEWAELSDYSFYLNSSESKTILFYAYSPDIDESYKITVTASLPNGISAEDSFIFDRDITWECFKVKPYRTEFNTNVYSKNFPLLLVNYGAKPGNYTVEWEGPDFTDYNLTNIYLPARDRELTYLFVNMENVSYNTYNGTISFYLESENLTYSYDIIINHMPKSFWLNAYEYFASTLCKKVMFSLLVLLILSFVALGIVKHKAPNYKFKMKNRIKQRKAAGLIILSLFIVISAAAIWFSGMPKVYEPLNVTVNNTSDNETAVSGIEFVWPEDTTYKINLQDYFYDPDNDTITFSVNEMENISARIKGDWLFLTPEPNWYGEDEMVLTAMDSKNATTNSDAILLRVIDREELRFKDYIDRLCTYVNLFILLCILTVVFFTCMFYRAPRKSKKE
ncbi:hypothetical protein JW949_01215 [Candidatus Woesearchaeota archaeon]|nr:hypothetical protein [Candidatus Woesearchaeota archaeon]